jgi:hypothetical protein
MDINTVIDGEATTETTTETTTATTETTIVTAVKLPQSTAIMPDEKPTIIGYMLLSITLLLSSPIILFVLILVICSILFSK